MRTPLIDRRDFLRGAGAGFAAALTPSAWAATLAADAVFATAFVRRDGSYGAGILSEAGKLLYAVDLPDRGHGMTFDPASRRAIVFPRKPGTLAVAFDHGGKGEPVTIAAPAGRHFYGHGVFSPDGALLYSIDTWARRVTVRDYDAASGAAGPRRVLLELDEGYPDGMCVDTDGYLWVAVWGLGRVHRYSPEGQLVRVVEVPAPHTSSVAFAGPALDVLVITTASDELSADELARFPLSGRLFTLRPGVTGLPVPRWGGFTLEETDHA